MACTIFRPKNVTKSGVTHGMRSKVLQQLVHKIQIDPKYLSAYLQIVQMFVQILSENWRYHCTSKLLNNKSDHYTIDSFGLGKNSSVLGTTLDPCHTWELLQFVVDLSRPIYAVFDSVILLLCFRAFSSKNTICFNILH